MSNGAFLWQTNQTYSNVQQMPSFGYGPPDGPYVQFDGVTSSYIGYDVKTGAQIWTAPVGTYPWGDIPAYYAICIGDVRYTFRYDGYLYAFSLTNGSLIWKSQSVGTTGETVEGTWTSGGSSYAGNSEPGVAADGKLYWSTQTNYRGEPMTRFNLGGKAREIAASPGNDTQVSSLEPLGRRECLGCSPVAHLARPSTH